MPSAEQCGSFRYLVQKSAVSTKVVAQIQAFTPEYMAMSTSLGFTSLLDGGLNYCNLYNLLSDEFRITYEVSPPRMLFLFISNSFLDDHMLLP
ncbi:hypothetical protein JOQ06_001823 [Pogonophryne albipinna]|uniref:Uncharacterized protein n=1 Tax=Pogonophryne albipinna TaxID=1090488 RepID=A0AAD6B634_9TELE|nr:hypothetical protein JOQ06_001823 [Pogonophryne albipinna]